MFTNAFTASGMVSSNEVPSERRPLLHDVTGEGEPIVLVPGTLTGWASWVAHAERLADSREVIRVQLRNVEFAETGHPIPASYSVQTEIDGLLAAVDELGLDRFDLAGWSLGGLVALAFAMRYPERVSTLTLVEPAAPWVLRATGHTGPWLDELEARDRHLSGKDVTIDSLKTFLVRAGFGSAETDFESHPRWPLMVRNRQALSVVDAVWDYTDSIDQLRGLEVPVLLVTGMASERSDRMIDRVIAQNAPYVTSIELPGDHACHIENIDQFLTALNLHLAL
jgi:pimeloyl-ACP methyl ester carboxylesterase